MTKTLDFIIIGAQKAGTTSLFEYLRQHPELSLPPGKEAPFFSHEETRFRGWERYLSTVFSFASPDTKWGTATPQYMVGGVWEQPNPLPGGESYDERTVPLRIKALAPEARLIAILRDPAQRALSHYRMAAMNDIETRSFDQAIDDLSQPTALEMARREPSETTGYITWGEYGRILSGYFDVFPPDQILVIYTTELEADPATIVRRVFEFLKVDPGFSPDNLGTRYRVGGSSRRFAWLGTYSALNPWNIQRGLSNNTVATRLWHASPTKLRRWISWLFSRFTYRLDLWNRRDEGRADDTSPDERALERLHAHYADDSAVLGTLLKSAPPWSETQDR